MQAGFITCWDTWWGTHQPWRVCWFQSSSTESFAPEELQFWHCASCKERHYTFCQLKTGNGCWLLSCVTILLLTHSARQFSLCCVRSCLFFLLIVLGSLSLSLFCHFTDMDVGSEISITLSLGHLWTLFRLSLTDCTYGENKFSMLYKEMMWFFVFLCWCWRERALFACLLSVFNSSKNFWYLILAIGSFLSCLYRSLLRAWQQDPVRGAHSLLLWLLVHFFLIFNFHVEQIYLASEKYKTYRKCADSTV